MEYNRLFRPTFNYLEEVYQDCLRRYRNNPKYNVDYPGASNDINKGRKILESDEEVDTYIALYGAHHYYKLISAFDALDLSKFTGKSFDILSYGCGPATDTCVLINYLVSNQINLSIESLTLIEPSITSLQRGMQYVQSAMIKRQADLKIKKINKALEELEVSDISSQPQTVKLHVFSNILDLEQINLDKLAMLLKNSQKGANYFICVSPNFSTEIARAHL